MSAVAHGVLRSDSRATGLAPPGLFNPALDLLIQAPGNQREALWKELFVMKRHRTASAVGVGTRNEGGTVASVADRTHTAYSENTRTQPASSEGSFVLARMSVRMHTLILTGELDYRSAHALEAEIDRLCEEGVTGITLDLRELKYIDSIGVAVIAFRCRLCKSRGYDIALIPGSRMIHRAFEQAGVSKLLPFKYDGIAAHRVPAVALADRSQGGCER
jgi:anti-sigma B factor antagonist